MSVSEDIYSNLSFGSERNRFSSLADIKSFFANFSPDTLKNWPLKPSEDIRHNFRIARITPDPFGFSQILTIAADICVENNKFTVLESFTYDGTMRVEISSILQTSGKRGSKFVFDFIQRHREFLKAFDKSQGDYGRSEPAEIRLNAHSGMLDSHQTSGGYIWAIQGFDFADSNELEQTQQAFKKFATRQGVIISERDLNLFRKPCHFAAFQCGVKVNGKHLGKAFLLQHSWYGKMSVPQNGSDSEEYRYAVAYNQFHGSENYAQKAAKELNRPYLRMMERYHKKYAQPVKRKISFLGQLQKAAKIFG